MSEDPRETDVPLARTMVLAMAEDLRKKAARLEKKLMMADEIRARAASEALAEARKAKKALFHQFVMGAITGAFLSRVFDWFVA